MKSVIAVAVVAQMLMVMADVQSPCALLFDHGPCLGIFLKYFYDKGSSQCVEFYYGGCGGNDNKFDTLDACKAACGPCTLPAEAGPCEGYFPKYFYNTSSRQCEQFIYGGCEGNANRYDTLNACNATCLLPVDG